MVAGELTENIRLVAIGAESRERWEAVVRTDANVNILQTPIWCDCICHSEGLEDVTRSYESPDGRLIVLPLVRDRRLPMQLKVQSSWPGPWGSCGLLATEGRIIANDVIQIIKDLQACNALRTSVPVPRMADGQLWEALVPADVIRDSRKTHMLDLSGGFDNVWRKRFAGAVRTAVRKAERLGITVESDTTGRLLPVFDALYRMSVDRWAKARSHPLAIARLLASRREPFRKFRIVADLLGEACEVHIAWLGGKPLAGTIILTHGAVATYWRGAMDIERAAGTGANELLHRVAIETACRKGCLQYDMQRSASQGLGRFKSKFGAQPTDFLEYRFENIPVTVLERRARVFAKRMLRMPTAEISS
ncbi:MAG: GNAT family N-acetyltransferase [Chloroflexota bacterium]|nr:GNAT family N-acetyltransferase [Chloroflexota bacterium]